MNLIRDSLHKRVFEHHFRWDCMSFPAGDSLPRVTSMNLLLHETGKKVGKRSMLQQISTVATKQERDGKNNNVIFFFYHPLL